MVPNVTSSEPNAALDLLVSVTDGEGVPVDLSTVSSIIDEDEGSHWIPTTPERANAAATTAGCPTSETNENENEEEKEEEGAKEVPEENGNTSMPDEISSDDAAVSPPTSVTTSATRIGGQEQEKRSAAAADCSPPAAHDVPPRSAPSPSPPPGIPLVCLSSGLSRKASPAALKSWIALSLTLDGRDKITKLCQYTSRLLAWYYESLARTLGNSVLCNDDVVEILLNKARKLRGLQIKLTESRKAYRLGRSLVELDKIRGMGWGPFLGYHLRHLIVAEPQDTNEEDKEEVAAEGGGSNNIVENGAPDDGSKRTLRGRHASSNVGWGPTTTIAADGTSSTAHHRPEHDENQEKKNKKAAAAAAAAAPRLLLRRASTNIGWGPATTAEVAPPPPSSRSASFYRSISNIGRRMYRPLTSQLALSYDPSTQSDKIPATPAWKIIGSTLKLLGLMGFWLGDNVNFLGSSGILDDMKLGSEERTKARGELRRRAGHFAARAYFMGAVSGLYVNSREVLRHRGGPHRTAVERVCRLEQRKRAMLAERRKSWDMEHDDDDEDGDDSGSDGDIDSQLVTARSDLEKIKGKQFVLFLAFLKSCCDVLVFSNNPGVDLHKRYRGRKMNEGFHSVCGLISASTVLYNNFPNKVKSTFKLG